MGSQSRRRWTAEEKLVKVDPNVKTTEWVPESGFCYLVDCLSSLTAAAPATIVTPDEFSYFAGHPDPYVLPVRRFFIDIGVDIARECDPDTIMASGIGRNIADSVLASRRQRSIE